MEKRAIDTIEAILKAGDRAEVIPGPKETVKIVRVKRKIALDTSKQSPA